MRYGKNNVDPPKRPTPRYIFDGENNNPFCWDCFYYRPLYRGDRDNAPHFCAYIIITGAMRGCPAGAGCDKRRLRRPDDPPVKYI